MCKTCNAEYKREYYQKNKEHLKGLMKENHEHNMKNPKFRSNRNEKNKEYRENNPPDHKKYYAENKDRIRENVKRYRDKPETKILRAAECRDRQARKLNATPAWANQGYIRLFYEGAKIEAERIGEPVDVDHIVPLQHPLVCGLHCEQNLQLLIHKENLTKSNTFLI